LLSIKLRTFDNLLIRIPNQTIISSELTNVTRFPIRRLDFNIGVAYKENLEVVRDTLIAIAHENPLCLEEPEPLLVFNGFGNSSIDVLLGVWFEKTNYLAVKNSVIMAIKARFDQLGIEIPFPHVTLYAGSATEAMPVRLSEESSAPAASEINAKGTRGASAAGGSKPTPRSRKRGS
jgi:small-conductance mechanosensitive channel